MLNLISTRECRKLLREEPEIEALLTPSEVASYLKISRQAVHKKLNKNEIPHEIEGRPGYKDKLIPAEDFLNWLYFERDVHWELYREKHQKVYIKKINIIKNTIVTIERMVNYGK